MRDPGPRTRTTRKNKRGLHMGRTIPIGSLVPSFAFIVEGIHAFCTSLTPVPHIFPSSEKKAVLRLFIYLVSNILIGTLAPHKFSIWQIRSKCPRFVAQKVTSDFDPATHDLTNERTAKKEDLPSEIPRLLAPRSDVFFSRLDLRLNLSPEREQKLLCGAYLLLKGCVM